MHVVLLLSAACIAAVLFGRIAVSLAVRYVPGDGSASLAMHWMHPLLLRGEIDVADKTLRLWLFGKFRVWPPRQQEKELRPAAPAASERKLPEAPAEGRFARTVDVAPPPMTRSESPAGESLADGAEKQSMDSLLAAPPEAPQSPVGRESSPRPPEITPPQAPAAEGKSIKQKISDGVESFKKSSFGQALFFVNQASWRGRMARWLKRCASFLPHLGGIGGTGLHIRLGLDDPALTGKLFGFWTGIKNGIFSGNADGERWILEPSFDGEYFSAEGSVALRSSLVRFVVLFALVFATFPYIATWRTWRASRRK